jgi:YD repeat-containing protein
MTDPLGNTTTLIYDPLDRVTQITDAKSGTSGFQYDPNSNLTQVTDANLNRPSTLTTRATSAKPVRTP